MLPEPRDQPTPEPDDELEDDPEDEPKDQPDDELKDEPQDDPDTLYFGREDGCTPDLLKSNITPRPRGGDGRGCRQCVLRGVSPSQLRSSDGG
jgi:hypothetical protein